MRAITLVAMIFSFTFFVPLAVASSVTPENHSISEPAALQAATKQIRKRGLILPLEYKTEVIKSKYQPEVGATTPLFSVTFYGGSVGHRVELYMVTIDRRTGEVDYVNNSLTNVTATPPSSTLSQEVVRTATNEIRRRQLPLPNGYSAKVTPSIISPERGRDRKVLFVTLSHRQVKHGQSLYQVAVNHDTRKVEFVLDLVARTMN